MFLDAASQRASALQSGHDNPTSLPQPFDDRRCCDLPQRTSRLIECRVFKAGHHRALDELGAQELPTMEMQIARGLWPKPVLSQDIGVRFAEQRFDYVVDVVPVEIPVRRLQGL